MSAATLADRLTQARGRLVAAGIPADEAAIDVDLYARRILGWDRANLLTRRGEQPPAGLEPTFSEWVARREQREPSAYIIGEREFYGRDFHVSPAVLIPRPETEHIIDAALPLLAEQPTALVADIGTGSGQHRRHAGVRGVRVPRAGDRRLRRRRSPSPRATPSGTAWRTAWRSCTPRTSTA